jgi:predicted metal-dependent hydrolase
MSKESEFQALRAEANWARYKEVLDANTLLIQEVQKLRLERRKWKEMQQSITRLFLDYGLSPVESDRLFESEKCFNEAFTSMMESIANEPTKKVKK